MGRGCPSSRTWKKTRPPAFERVGAFYSQYLTAESLPVVVLNAQYLPNKAWFQVKSESTTVRWSAPTLIH